MSKHLTVTQTVELLEHLRATVREFAATEEKINRDFRVRNEAVQKRFAAEIAEHEAACAARLTEEEANSRAALETLQGRHEQRKRGISKAYNSSKRQATDRIEKAEGQRKYNVQTGQLQTKRTREESLARNDAQLADFTRQLEENRNAFATLEGDARKSFRGYGKFRRQLRSAIGVPNIDASLDEYRLLEQLRELHARTEGNLRRFRTLLAPKLFKYFPLGLWVVILAGSIPLLQNIGAYSVRYEYTAAGTGLVLAVVFVVYFTGRAQASPLAEAISRDLASARKIHELCLERARARHARESEGIEAEAGSRNATLQNEWRSALEEASAARELLPQRVKERWQRTSAANETFHQARSQRLERARVSNIERLQRERAMRKKELDQALAAALAKFTADHLAQWKNIEADWRRIIEPIDEAFRAANRAVEEEFPAWDQSLLEKWMPPLSFKNAARFARVEVDLKKFAEIAPQDNRLAFPAGSFLTLPLLLKYPLQGSVLFETTRSAPDTVIASINNIIFRLLATTPAGKLSFTIIDPVKLGQNFATVMHLADYEDNLINGRIWTQSNQIEERLAALNEHMEKVIQMYLRNEYETIAEYNLEAGNIAEKYHFVVIADFPANFSETAIRRLLRVAASGARCGVYTLIHWDHRHPAPAEFLAEELRKSSVCIDADQLALTQPALPRAGVQLDAPPEPDLATHFLQRVGEISRGSNRVEVPFAQVAPNDSEIWSLDTTEELRVPIGRSGATKLQYLSIGKGTRQHALVAGKTGSGKSTLFHVIITNLALWCRPEQVEFYLVDFKKGVEFKAYAAARLPHARVVAIESDREFGLSVLQRLDDELKRRGDLFRALGVQDLAGYKNAGGSESIPRSLLIIDEFQEFFVEDDRISQAAAVWLDRVVRQGRAFGIHVLLGSQTLGGAYTLARTTIGQMVIRIALQCNEADAYLIMDENNAAPRLLSRPGEGIYNDMAGAIEGNSPFQAVWLSDADRDVCLERVRKLADQNAAAYSGPIVFEGNAPSDVRENSTLRAVLQAETVPPTPEARVWLGAPNSIKGPTEAVFKKRSGNNLLVVGQREEAVLAIVSLSLVALAAQFPPANARFVLIESTLPGSAERALFEQIIASSPHPIDLVRSSDIASVIGNLAKDLKKRADTEGSVEPITFVIIHGLQNFKKLRQDDDFSFASDAGTAANAAADLQRLISEGPAHGLHIIATVDTFNNVNRFLGRKSLSEFEMRVLFQMSANDSASLCDDPKASNLGLHRALFYNEQEGYLETFRPYALPSLEWFQETAKMRQAPARGRS